MCLEDARKTGRLLVRMRTCTRGHTYHLRLCLSEELPGSIGTNSNTYLIDELVVFIRLVAFMISVSSLGSLVSQALAYQARVRSQDLSSLVPSTFSSATDRAECHLGYR